MKIEGSCNVIDDEDVMVIIIKKSYNLSDSEAFNKARHMIEQEI